MFWKGFQKPKRLECDFDSLTPRYGRFYAQPFERGFGVTIGNALRRVLLSSIEGAAITAVRIDGVLHEFSSLQGVGEDVTDIILNLKSIPFKLHSGYQETVTLYAEGPCEVRAGDIECSANIEILDREVLIATLNEEGRLSMEMRVRRARGYVTADRNYEPDLGIGYIPLDSVHSPVRKVNFDVEDARLGQTTDYDRLLMEVWTNGAVRPQDAIGQAAKLVKDHMSIFLNFEEEAALDEELVEEEDVRINENLDRSVEELELSVRSYNCLRNAGIKTIRDLVTRTESEMLRTKNFGRKSLNEIKEILAEMNLALGMFQDEGAGQAAAEETDG